MKNFLIIFMAAFSPFACAMQQTTRAASTNTNREEKKQSYNSAPRRNQTQAVKEYIDLNDSIVEHHTGTNMKYYKEYGANSRGKNLVSFPLGCCDPLPIEQFGDTKYFFTSAVEGTSVREVGQPFGIADSSIKQMVVVRGKSEGSGYCVQVYMGFDPDNYKTVGYKGCNKVHTATIMALQIKKKSAASYFNGSSYLASCYGGWIQTVPMASATKSLEIGQTVRKHLTDQKDFNWNSPIFQQKIGGLLGSRAKDFNFETQQLASQVCYWTEKENKLKGITYE